MVWQTYNAVKIPIIGIGGIQSATDAIEFILAGATAIEIGTANFVDPNITMKVADGIADYMQRHKIDNINTLRGALKV